MGAPDILSRMLRRLHEGKLEVEIGRIDRFGSSIERGAVATAAFVIGLAPILAESGPRLWASPPSPCSAASPPWPASPGCW